MSIAAQAVGRSPFVHYNGSPPYVANSETSRQASASMKASSPAIRERVFSFVSHRMSLGATCDEIETGLQMSHQTASARCRELVLQGRLFKLDDPITGKPIRRKTRSGRNADVLFAKLS